MAKSLTQYRVFIASPGGLEEERECFRDLLEKYTRLHAEPRGVTFFPVGWEDTIGGAGRPQELINEDLRQCDYAVFVLHDRWGTPTGSGYTSGTEEEWELAETLYKETKIRNIALFFKDVDPRQLRDPGKQLARVLQFKVKIEAGKRFLFKSYAKADAFREGLEGHLAKWLRDHESDETGPALGVPAIPKSEIAAGARHLEPPPASPGFEFWITEARKLLNAEPAETRNYMGVLFCAERASAAAASEMEWAKAKNTLGIAQSRLNKPAESIAQFTEIAERFNSASDTDRLAWRAIALVNKGVTLGQLSRSEEAIAVYEDVIARFGSAPELPLREQVAPALVYKGVTLGELKRSEEAIAVCDDVVARFGTASEASLRQQVARALVNKGVRLGELKRSEEAIAVCDDVVARFGTAPGVSLREPVARALVYKGITLGELKRSEEAIAVYDDMVARFGTASEASLRQQVAKALVNKGIRLGQLKRSEEAIAVYDDVVARFGTSEEPSLKVLVERARTMRRRPKPAPKTSTRSAKRRKKRDRP
jgi:tetratricopeptide (TPR) repeat protein